MSEDSTKQDHSSLSVAPASVEQRFTAKMDELKNREREHEVREEAIRRGYGYLNLIGLPIDQECLKCIPPADAEKLRIICFAKTKEELRVALVDPDGQDAQATFVALAKTHDLPIGLYLVSERSMAAALKLYAALPKERPHVSGIAITAQDLERFRKQPTELSALGERIIHTPLTEVLSLIVAGATQSRATDIHIEAEEHDVKVRYRIDGVLHTVASLPRDTWKKIVSRIKLLAGLKLNVEDRPQDGRITLNLSDEKIDIRVSTVPTAFGESIALRLLLSSAASYDLDELGLRGATLDELKRQIGRPTGMIVVTGPTGSGKTTTLYAILRKLNNPETKIITLEDPIEYRIEGINQSQVDPDQGYTFVRGLKHSLRQDPDIIMVGEIRDLETAEIAIQSTLTGHLVLTTLHTNSAAGAIPRFLSIGVKPYLLAPALNCVVAQRLVRRLCQHCREKASIDGETMERARATLDSIPETSTYRVPKDKALEFYVGRGCAECNNAGYIGRIGIFEVMIMNADLEKLILAGTTSEYEITDMNHRHGLLTLAQDGVLKALEGATSIDEIFRVAG